MTNRPPLWKQAAGALLGATIAVGGYSAYKGGADVIRAYLIPPGFDTENLPKGDVDMSNDELVQREERLDAKAREAVRRMRALTQAQDTEASSAPAHTGAPIRTETPAAAQEFSVDAAAILAAQRENRLEARLSSMTSPSALPRSGPGAFVAAAGGVAGLLAARRRIRRA